MFGVVDKEGKLTGKDVVYVYPDEKSYLKGQFEVWQNSRGVCVCVWGESLRARVFRDLVPQVKNAEKLKCSP